MNLTITNEMIINYMYNGVIYPLNKFILSQNGVDNVVASAGTFYKNSSMLSWRSGASGIPSNWTIQYYVS